MAEDLKTGNAKPEPPKDGVALAIRNTGDLFETISKTVADGVAGAGTAGVALLDAVAGVVRNAVRSSVWVGGNIVVGVKAIVMGVIRGTGMKGEAALQSLARTTRSVIRQTSEMNGDVGAAASALVLAARSAAKHMEVDPAQAAASVREAALQEAVQIGAVAADKVRGAFKDVDATPVAAPALKT